MRYQNSIICHAQVFCAIKFTMRLLVILCALALLTRIAYDVEQLCPSKLHMVLAVLSLFQGRRKVFPFSKSI